MKSLKIGFAGSPAFAEKILSALLQEKSDFFSINMIITQAPKRKGRGLNLIKTPVSILGEKNSIPVFSPESFLKKNCELKKKLNEIFPNVFLETNMMMLGWLGPTALRLNVKVVKKNLRNV